MEEQKAARQKRAAARAKKALLKGLRDGTVEKVVGEMEADEAAEEAFGNPLAKGTGSVRHL